MPSINSYLNFPGNTEEAFKFYQSVFGGELNIMRFSDTPDAGNMPPTVKDKVMHASLPIGKNDYLMATDACEEMGFTLTQGNNYYICISPDSKEDADKKLFFDSITVDLMKKWRVVHLPITLILGLLSLMHIITVCCNTF